MQADVHTFAWNPRRSINAPLVRRLTVGRRTNNFGDLVGPRVVDLIRDSQGLSRRSASGKPQTLFSVGSVLHFAADGDVVWGSGINGKIREDRHEWRTLDVRAVRGPLTREWMSMKRGQDVPPVYGDPALLLFELGYPKPERSHERSLTIVPNLNDPVRNYPPEAIVSPRSSLATVLSAISSSEGVVTSSLHALLFAELLSVPVALLKPADESPFKYLDYAAGTGRDDIPMFPDFAAAAAHVRSHRDDGEPLSAWSSAPLRAAFPSDLFAPEGSRR